MIITRFCPIDLYLDFTEHLNEKGYTIIEVNTLSDMVQVKYTIPNMVNMLFDDTIRPGDTSE
jgi:hypothetical protein